MKLAERTLSKVSCSLCRKRAAAYATCAKCKSALCENHSGHCPCDHVTTEHALIAALFALGARTPTVRETLIVEDECGVFFGLSGRLDWLLQTPLFYVHQYLETCLPDEFAHVHEPHQLRAIKKGQAGYITQNFCVAIHRFDIDGRMFTASVFAQV